MGDVVPIRDPDLEVTDYPDLPIREGAAEALVLLRQAIAAADEQRTELANAGDTDSLAIGLVAFRMLVRDLRTLADATEADLARIMGEHGARRIDLDHVGTFERKRSTTRRAWQTGDLAARLVSDAMARDVIHHPSDVVDLLLECASISGFKVTPLRALGLDPSEWCEENREDYSIRHTPPGGAAK
jgi:hypothetical protein